MSATKSISNKTTIVRQGIPHRPRRHFPRTFEERAALGVSELRVPATFEEYLALAHDCDYRLHYRDGHIISFIEIDEVTQTVMGEATITHEGLVMRIGHLLATIFQKDYNILGSNTKLFIGEQRRGYNADVVVVQGPVSQKTYKYNKRSLRGVNNPWLIVEVLSDSTREFDLSEKLTDYKTIPSLQQIIFIEQSLINVTTYIRVGPNEWRNLDFHGPDDQLPVGDGLVSLRAIYQRIPEGPLA